MFNGRRCYSPLQTGDYISITCLLKSCETIIRHIYAILKPHQATYVVSLLSSHSIYTRHIGYIYTSLAYFIIRPILSYIHLFLYCCLSVIIRSVQYYKAVAYCFPLRCTICITAWCLIESQPLQTENCADLAAVTWVPGCV